MSELKAGQVRIFQCESCGEIFDPSHQDAEAGWHLGVEVVADEHGEPEPSPFQCGPISERILFDEEHIQKEIESWNMLNGKVFDDLYGAYQDEQAGIGFMSSGVTVDRVQADKAYKEAAQRLIYGFIRALAE